MDYLPGALPTGIHKVLWHLVLHAPSHWVLMSSVLPTTLDRYGDRAPGSQLEELVLEPRTSGSLARAHPVPAQCSHGGSQAKAGMMSLAGQAQLPGTPQDMCQWLLGQVERPVTVG